MSTKLFGDTGNVEFGNPDVYQQYGDTCAIQSQRLILEKFGISLTQDELIEEATLNGWYTRDSGQGTRMEDVGKLLENHGVNVEVSDNNNIFSLVNELAQNHQVIVAVDSSELWERGSWKNSLEDFFKGGVPDHALIVSGLDASDPNNVQVVLTDPGTGDVRIRYSEQEFLNAWKDSNCWMMTTESAPQDVCNDWDYTYSFAGIPANTLQLLGDSHMDVTCDEYSDFVGSLCESPEMPWEEIVTAISMFMVKEIIRTAFDDDDHVGVGAAMDISTPSVDTVLDFPQDDDMTLNIEDEEGIDFVMSEGDSQDEFATGFDSDFE